MAQRARDRLVVLIGLPLISLVMVFANGSRAFQSVPVFLVTWGVSFVYTLVLGLGNREIWRRLQDRYPRVEQTKRRLWYLALGSVAYTSVATVVLTLAVSQLLPGSTRISWPTLLVVAAINLIPTLVGQLVYESRHFFQQWEENLLRADQLARASTQAQLDALQSQLDPHFLFNNLNTLSALIEPGNEPAQAFVDQLADVYRYVLQAQGRATVPLAEELAFVDSYLALHRARFGSKLVVEVQVAQAARQRLVAPLSVQLLVENALKHNVASHQQPLHLRLTAAAADEFLTVENTYQPRQAGLTAGTGTGLDNVRRRYQLLAAARPVVVEKPAGKFTVKLPLL
jgi:sensor histidine kinase YesM